MTTEQGQDILQEVKMVEEQKVEEKAEVTELEPEQPVSEAPTPEAEQPEATPEPISEIPGGEVSPELTEPMVEEKPEVISEVETPAEEIPVNLTEEVKTKLLACAEEDGCIDALLGRFEQVASKLGIPTEKLIDQVFGLLQGEKIES